MRCVLCNLTQPKWSSIWPNQYPHSSNGQYWWSKILTSAHLQGPCQSYGSLKCPNRTKIDWFTAAFLKQKPNLTYPVLGPTNTLTAATVHRRQGTNSSFAPPTKNYTNKTKHIFGLIWSLGSTMSDIRIGIRHFLALSPCTESLNSGFNKVKA